MLSGGKEVGKHVEEVAMSHSGFGWCINVEYVKWRIKVVRMMYTAENETIRKV